MISNFSSVAYTAFAPTFPASRTQQYEWFDDFSSIGQNGAITTSTSVFSDTKWTAGQISTGTGIFRNAANAQIDASHIGILELTNSTATSGLGVYIAKGGGSNASGLFNPSTTLFDITISFKLSTTATNAMYFGFISGAGQSTVPTTNATTFTGLRYDTSLGDTNLMFGSQAASAGALVSSGVAASTNWTTFRMRSVVAGTILMSVNGGAETAVSTNISNSVLDIVLQQINRTTASATVFVDYIGCRVAGLTR